MKEQKPYLYGYRVAAVAIPAIILMAWAIYVTLSINLLLKNWSAPWC